MSFFDLAAPISLPTKFAVAAVVVVGIAAAGYVKGYGHGTEKLVEFKTQVAAASAKAEADAEALRAEQQRILADTARGWSAAVDWHRAHPRTVRVLSPAQCYLPQAGAVPATPAEPDARPVEHGSGAVELTAEQCEARINAAVLDAAQVVWLRDFIHQQHEASK